MFLTADIVLAHLVGDYIVQSDYMATQKTGATPVGDSSADIAALTHAITYTITYLCITKSPLALALILVSHLVIDRWRLARYVCWAKNFIFSPWSSDMLRAAVTCSFGPTSSIWSHYRRPWSECAGTGYPGDRPAWLTVWLLIIADNTLHLLCNAAAVSWF